MPFINNNLLKNNDELIKKSTLKNIIFLRIRKRDPH